MKSRKDSFLNLKNSAKYPKLHKFKNLYEEFLLYNCLNHPSIEMLGKEN